MTKFVRNPPEIDAIQWDGTMDGVLDIQVFLSPFFARGVIVTLNVEFDQSRTALCVLTLDRSVLRDLNRPIRQGEWLVREDNGIFEIYPDDAFKIHYSPKE